MAAKRITFANKAQVLGYDPAKLNASEVNAVKDTLNDHADLLDTLTSVTGKTINELVLPQDVVLGSWYLTATGIWEAVRSFSAAAAPIPGANWRRVVAFTNFTANDAVQAVKDSGLFYQQGTLGLGGTGRTVNLRINSTNTGSSFTIALHELIADKATMEARVSGSQLERGLQYQYIDGGDIISFHAVRANVPGALGTRYQLGSGGASIILIEPVRVIWSNNVLTWQTLATGGGGSTSPTGIDFTNPVTLSSAAPLEGNKAYYVTGAGYTLTLPDAAQNVGKAIFISIAKVATGMYPVSSLLSMYAGETVNLRALPDGWQETGGKPLAMAARIETTLSQQDIVPQGDYWQVPATTLIERNGPVALVQGATIVSQRAGRATIAGAAYLVADTDGYFVLGLRRVRGGVASYPVQVPIRKPATGNVAYNAFSVPVVTQPGDVYDLVLYTEASSRLRGQYPGSQCSLIFNETV